MFPGQSDTAAYDVAATYIQVDEGSYSPREIPPYKHTVESVCPRCGMVYRSDKAVLCPCSGSLPVPNVRPYIPYDPYDPYAPAPYRYNPGPTCWRPVITYRANTTDGALNDT